MTVRLLRSLITRLTSMRSSAPDNEPVDKKQVDVLFVNGCDLETLRRYRVSHQREQLELRGITTDEVFYTSVQPSDAERAQTFVIYRCPWTPEVEGFITHAHELGRLVYYDVDDLVCDTAYTDELDVVKNMTPEEKAVFDDGVTRNGRTLALCDGAIVTTERLAQELGRVVPVTFINRNVASLEMAQISVRASRESRCGSNDAVHVGYFSGSMTHNVDFEQIVSPLARVMENHDEVMLDVVGDLELPPQLAPFASRVVTHEKVDWHELPALLASVDINLAPLEPTLFNEAKSENKWTEASLVGVPTVASNFGAFAHVIKQGERGLLCATEGEWEKALDLLVTDHELRQSLGRRAQSYCRAHCVTDTAGFGLAHLLCNVPTEISTMAPTSDQGKAALVDSWLSSRNVARPTTEFHPAPWEAVSLADRTQGALGAIADGQKLLIAIYERTCGDTATFRYFGYNVAQRLESSESWHGTYLFVDELSQSQELLSQASCINMIRCRIRPELIAMAKDAKARNQHIAYTIDDNVLGVEAAPRVIQAIANNPDDAFEKSFWTGVCIRFALASELADALFVPNQFFAGLLGKTTDKPICVIHASMNNEQLAISNYLRRDAASPTSFDAPFAIGYFSGTASHNEDFALVHDALVSFLNSHEDALLVLGGHLQLSEELYRLSTMGRVVTLPSVDYATLQALQASMDVVLAPLVVDDFSNCKSGLKVFEAGAMGAPACASPAYSYVEAIDDGESGFVCDEEGAWIDALEKLYVQRDLRAQMAEKAREKSLGLYSGIRIRAEIEDACDCCLDAPVLSIPKEPAQAVQTAISNGVRDWDDPFVTNPAFAKALNA